jgi:uncharacterized glyoxalase superfamily protein PhnB
MSRKNVRRPARKAPSNRSGRHSASATKAAAGPARKRGKTRSRDGSRTASPTASARAGVTSGLAPGLQAINTYLAVANVAASIHFLERAFGFTRGVVLADPDGQPRYAEMRHATSAVMLIRRGDLASATLGTTSLYTYVDDVDRQVAMAREAGAGVSEPEDKPWGDRVAVVTDPDGYRWVLASFKKLVPFA